MCIMRQRPGIGTPQSFSEKNGSVRFGDVTIDDNGVAAIDYGEDAHEQAAEVVYVAVSDIPTLIADLKQAWLWYQTARKSQQRPT